MDEREALTHLRSIVVRGGADGSADLAHACVTALRERGWAGDGELAGALDAVLGSGPTPMLRPLPVDLEEHMEGFIDDLDDPQFAGLLARAISGRGAFRRSKDTLAERPDLMTRWCD